ncbi:hypothetical protein EVAR_81799_1 [Eumeta japonica]|uniref:Uncharacterized protein n=1 Tax=Eumeta variegata TaxID=151549 RepID=A0A4C1UJ53_EUMVA|nr:hypothetical protein EVAR_81799_1 [Eumeta japonica]
MVIQKDVSKIVSSLQVRLQGMYGWCVDLPPPARPECKMRAYVAFSGIVFGSYVKKIILWRYSNLGRHARPADEQMRLRMTSRHIEETLYCVLQLFRDGRDKEIIRPTYSRARNAALSMSGACWTRRLDRPKGHVAQIGRTKLQPASTPNPISLSTAPSAPAPD